MPFNSLLWPRFPENAMTTALNEQLRSLHQQLAALDEAPPATREQLLILLADISRLLDSEVPSNSPAEALETLATRFDMKHPALSEALRRLVDALGKAGI
jgi:hypothetical protein